MTDPLARAGPRRRPLEGRRLILLRLAAVIAFLAGWELVARSGWIRPIFISSPSRILKAAALLAEGRLWNDLIVSGTEFVIGILLAVVVGLALGILVGWYRSLSALLDPFIAAIYSTPRVALLPLIILWLGIGVASKIAVVFLGAVFPVLVSTMAGVRAVDEDMLVAARSFGASDRQVFWTLALPSAVPFIVAGLQLGVGRGLVGVVVGEFIASRAGIGHMMSTAAATFQTDKTFVGIFVLAGTGVLLSSGLAWVERRVDRWRPRRE